MPKSQIDQYVEQLKMISDVYPTLRGMMTNKPKNRVESVGLIWAKTLVEAKLDFDHFENVCVEFARFERQLPEPSDRLPQAIVFEVKRRMQADEERLRYNQDRMRYRLVKGGDANARNYTSNQVLEAWSKKMEISNADN